MATELEWYVASLYGPERGEELCELFEKDAILVSDEILASLRECMARPRPKRTASMIRSRVSNLEEHGEAVCMLVFMTVEKGQRDPCQHAVFIGPHSFCVNKGKDIMGQFERFMQKEGKDGDICLVQFPKS